jgi:hypothetical protein
MKPLLQSHNLFAAISLTVSTLALSPALLQASVTLDGSDVFVVSGAPTGDLAIFGDLSVVKGIDFGTAVATPAQAAVQLNYFGGSEKAAKFDITDAAGTFQWRDNLVGTARDKMKLDANNLLSLYNSAGTAAGISLNGNNGQINLSGTGSGIYSGGNPVFTLDSSGNLVFGATLPFSITNATASSSSATGALTVSGGIGAVKDSYFNNVRIGKGNSGVATNTVVGSLALNMNSTGQSNTAVGASALSLNTSGSSNTALGASTLAVNTTGGGNTGVGSRALYNNTTGTANTALGTNSLQFNTSGGWNAAFGLNSHYYNTTGTKNAAIAALSLYYNTSGSNNVALGYGAGRFHANGSTQLTDPENSIYIGAESKAKDNNDSNSIVIGYNSVGEGPNTTVIGNSSTIKTHLYGQVEASSFTVNNIPVMTTSAGVNSTLSGGGRLSIGDYASATQSGAIAIGYNAIASSANSISLGSYANSESSSYESIAMIGGRVTKGYGLAAAYGEATGEISMAFGGGIAGGDSSIALGGYDWQQGNWPGNQSTGENSATIGGVGNQAVGFSSLATGFWSKATSFNAVALGSLNVGGVGASASAWVETDPLFELGNGKAPRSDQEPTASNRSNAITTLKNGQTTLTNKEWKAATVADPNTPATALADPSSPTDSDGNALVVDGHTVLNGKVTIAVPQGDISMGIYGGGN